MKMIFNKPVKTIFTLPELKSTKVDDEVLRTGLQMILSIDELKDNIDIFIKYSKKVLDYCCKDYESALLLNRLMNDGKIESHNITLMDDNKMQDRSYIDTTIFNNRLIIPDSYLMCGVKYQNTVITYCFTNKARGGYYFDTENIEIDNETIQEAKRIASMIAEFPYPLTDIEKIIIVSNYIQMYNQFIGGLESHVGQEKYVIDSINDNDLFFKKINTNDSIFDKPSTALLRHFGVCRTFAFATTLLLNNPYLKINIKNVKNDIGDHIWNVVELNGKLYHLDNSRNISRGKNRMDDALRATKFNIDYLLIGQDTIRQMGHETIADSLVLYSPLSDKDIDRNYIEAAIENLENTGMISFEYGDKAFYSSHKI